MSVITERPIVPLHECDALYCSDLKALESGTRGSNSKLSGLSDSMNEVLASFYGGFRDVVDDTNPRVIRILFLSF